MRFFWLLFLTVFLSCKRSYVNPDLSVKDNRVYDSSGKLVHGEVVFYYANGQKSNLLSYRDGVSQGPWQVYDHEGAVIQNGVYSRSQYWKNLIGNSGDVDFEIVDNWNEGDQKFVSIYVYLKNKNVKIIKQQAIQMLDKLGSGNREVLFLYNRDTVEHIRKW